MANKNYIIYSLCGVLAATSGYGDDIVGAIAGSWKCAAPVHGTEQPAVTNSNWQQEREAHPDSGVYLGEFTVPASWDGKRVHADWEGAPKNWKLSVNGREVAPECFRYYFLWEANQQIEVNLTDYLVPGVNTIRVETSDPKIGPVLRMFLADPEIKIGKSKALPHVGETVTFSRLKSELKITAPDGSESILKPDADGKCRWTPKQYGLYRLQSGDTEEDFRVTATELLFPWYNDTGFARNVTHVVVCRPVRLPAWTARGVVPLKWIGGEFYQREVMGSLRTPAQWLDQWRNYDLKWWDGPEYSWWHDSWFGGTGMDELFLSPRAAETVVCDASNRLAKELGFQDTNFIYVVAGEITPYSPMAYYFQTEKPWLLLESYEGRTDLNSYRWNNSVRRYGLEERSLICLEPTGDAERDRQIVASARLGAPEARGLAQYGGSAHLTAYLDAAIDEYFFRPVLHLRPWRGKLRVSNLGQEDAKGAKLQLDAALVDVPALKPGEFTDITIPANTAKIQLIPAKGMTNLYEFEPFASPAGLDPFRVEEVRILPELKGAEVRFSRPVSADLSGKFKLSGTRQAEEIELEAVAGATPDCVTIPFPALTADAYELRISGTLQAGDGGKLDGDDDGFPTGEVYSCFF